MKRTIRIAVALLIAAVFAGTFVYLYQKSKKAPTLYEVETAAYADISRTTVLNGNIEPRDKVEIKPQINGIIAEIYKQPGEAVHTGDIIAKVKVIPGMEELNAAGNRVRVARINLEQANRDYDRAKKLYDDKLISAEEYEKAQQDLKKAKEESRTSADAQQIVKEGVSASNSTYSTTLIRSTINGIILDIPVKVGNSVIMSNTMNDGTTIATVADMNDLIFKGTIDETEVGLVSTGMPMTITVGALQDHKFSAQLEYISPEVESSTNGSSANQFEIKAAVKVSPEVKIRSGYSANAEIELQKAAHVVSVPEGCVEFSGDTTFVYVLTKNEPQTFERRKVTTGLSDGVKIEIKSGLKTGDKVRGNIKSDEAGNNGKVE
mgnify:CR=1 FL=1